MPQFHSMDKKASLLLAQSSSDLPDSNDDPSSSTAIMKQMQDMQRQMAELQRLLLSKQSQESQQKAEEQTAVKNDPVVGISTKPHGAMVSKSSTPVLRHASDSKMRLMDADDEGILFFNSNSNNKYNEKSSRSQNTPSKKISPLVDTRSDKNIKMSNSKKMSAKSALEDSDSDWEDMDGESKNGLSEEGKQLKRLLKMGERKKDELKSGFSSSFNSGSSSPRDWKKKIKEKSFTSDSSKGKIVPEEDKYSLQCASSYTEQSKSGTQKPASDSEKIVTEEFSKIRIVNPLISSYIMKSRMEDRKLISVSRIHSKMNTVDLQGDWVTIGVVVSKTNAKASSSGKPYSIWKLSDLHDLDNCVSFFLFGQVHKNHWKLDVGTVVGILNPNMMESMEKNKSQPAFTIKNPNQLMVMGISKDLGWCVSITKKGNKCTHFLNKRQGDYCSYHVQAEYKKTSAQRLEFHGSVTGFKPKSFEQKIFSKNCAYMYGGQTFVPNSAASGSKKGLTLSKLKEKAGVSSKKVNTFSIQNIKSTADSTTPKGRKITEDKDDVFMDMISVPSPGAMNLVAHLKKIENGSKVKSSSPSGSTGIQKAESISASDLIKQHRQMMQSRQSKKPKASELLLATSPKGSLKKDNSSLDPLKERPVLGKGFGQGQDIDLNFGNPSQTSSVTSSSKVGIFTYFHYAAITCIFFNDNIMYVKQQCKRIP